MSTNNNQGWPSPLGAAPQQPQRPVAPQANAQWGALPPSIAPQSGQGNDVLVEPSYDGSPSTFSVMPQSTDLPPVPPTSPAAAPSVITESEERTMPLPDTVEQETTVKETPSVSETQSSDTPESAQEVEPVQRVADEQVLNTVQEVLHTAQSAATELTDVKESLDALSQQFTKRLQYDDTKETIIDRQHSELLKLREGLKDNLIQPVLYDVAEALDTVRKMRASLSEEGEKTDRAFEDIEYMLLDILEKNDVEEVASEPGDAFNASRQRMIRYEETDDPAKRKTVVRSLAPGYLFGKTALFKEKVVVYKVVTPAAPAVQAAAPTAEPADE